VGGVFYSYGDNSSSMGGGHMTEDDLAQAQKREDLQADIEHYGPTVIGALIVAGALVYVAYKALRG